MPKLQVDGWTCPHKRVCWQREAIRVGVAALVAGLVSLCGGCAVHWNGLGVDLKLTPPAPSAAPAAPAAVITPATSPAA